MNYQPEIKDKVSLKYDKDKLLEEDKFISFLERIDNNG